jgi:hypothetical protein
MEAQTITTSPTPKQSLQREEEKKRPPSMSSTPQGSEKDTNKIPEPKTATEEEHDFITGLKLAIVVVSVTLVSLLMLLDISIIITVNTPIKNY